MTLILCFFLLLAVSLVHCEYDTGDIQMRDVLKVGYRTNAASFVRNNVLYSFGGERPGQQVAGYFDSISLNKQDGSITYTTIERNNDDVTSRFAMGCQAIYLPETDRVLIFGGERFNMSNENRNDLMFLEQFDFDTRSWTSLPIRAMTSNGISARVDLPGNRRDHVATLARNGKIYIAGGRFTGNITDTYLTWAYDPSANIFSPVPNPQPEGLFGIDTYGDRGVALPDGRIVYTSSLRTAALILDTNTNRTFIQENLDLNGISPADRTAYATELPLYISDAYTTLAPDQKTIIYFGGQGYTSMGAHMAYNALFMLDTETWRWTLKANVSQLDSPPTARFGVTGGILYGKYILITHGLSDLSWYNTFDVLQLPDTSSNILSGQVSWISNIIPVQQKDEKNGLSGGAIAGIVIGCAVLILIVALGVWFWNRGVKSFLQTVFTFLVWDPRTGEPRWTELTHLFTKIVLTGIFIVYVIYNIQLALDSPISPLTITTPVNEVRFPEIRICMDSDSVTTKINCHSDTMSSADCAMMGFLEPANMSKYNPYFSDTITGYVKCWLFTPSEDFRIKKSETGKYNRIRLSIYDEGEAGSGFFNIELYPHGKNPNLIVYKDQEQPMLSEDEMFSWLGRDWNVLHAPNKYTIAYPSMTSITYQHVNRSYLTDSYWNVVGFAQTYNHTIDLTTSAETNPRSGDLLATYVEIYPDDMVQVTMQDRKVYSLVTGLGSAGGLLSLLITIDTIMFGARPKSPWGIIQRFSMGRIRRSLLDALYGSFGHLGRPIPFVHPVHERFLTEKDTIELAITKGDNPSLVTIGRSTSIAQPLESMEQRIQLVKEQQQELQDQFENIQRRLQLMETVYKAFYITDDVFLNLDIAHNELSKSSGRDSENTTMLDEQIIERPAGFARLFRKSNRQDEDDVEKRKSMSMAQLQLVSSEKEK